MDLDGNNAQIVASLDKDIHHYKYSPDGKQIAIVQEVEVGSAKHTDLPKAEAYIYDDLTYRHWDSWSDRSYSHVFVGAYSTEGIKGLKDILANEPYDCPVKPFHGSEDFLWSPDGTHLIYVCKKVQGSDYATSTNTEIYAYNIASGSTRNLTEGMEGYDTQPTFNNEGTQLAWLSMKRNGYESDKNDIVVTNWPEATKRVNITTGWDGTVSSFSYQPNDKSFLFQADLEATVQLFELDAPSKVPSAQPDKLPEPRQVTSGDHNLGGVIGVSGQTIVSSKTGMNRARELVTVNMKSGEVSVLTHVNDFIYRNLKQSKVEKRWVTTYDGKRMLVWVVFPPDFDPNQKYPTLLYCQGGPQSAVSQFYSFRWNFQLMAANGYIIVAPNRRGLPGFGTEWNEAISQDWGGAAMKDYLAAFDEVAKEPYVDKERTGAIGASYGGYSVYMLAGIHEKRFKSFISHCGLFNLESWYGSTEELFFANFDVGGPYWGENPPAGYQTFSPHRYADNGDTPILVIHGGRDYRVPDTQGMEAFQVAQLKGLKSRFLYFPNEGHWILRPQNGLVWHREFFSWLDETVRDL